MAKHKPVWVTRGDAAGICGCGERNFDDVVRRRLPAAAIKGKGKAIQFDAVKVVIVLLDRHAEDVRKTISTGGEELGGDTSPAMERVRIARAKMIEMDLAEREKRLVRVEAVTEALQPAIAAMRTTGERLTKQFGNAAAEIYNEGLGEFEAAAIRVLEESAGGDRAARPRD